MNWKILDTGRASAQRNMEIDHELLRSLTKSQQGILHFYRWEAPTATYGYFVEPLEYFDLEAVNRLQVQLAKRPTGGGITFHIYDFAFSILMPASHPQYSENTLANYAYVNQQLVKAISLFRGSSAALHLQETPSGPGAPNFCMAAPIQYDVMLNGRKIGGGAQRRTRFGFLHQGTIALSDPPLDVIEGLLKVKTDVLQIMQHKSTSLLGFGAHNKPELLEEVRCELQERLVAIVSKNF